MTSLAEPVAPTRAHGLDPANVVDAWRIARDQPMSAVAMQLAIDEYRVTVSAPVAAKYALASTLLTAAVQGPWTHAEAYGLVCDRCSDTDRVVVAEVYWTVAGPEPEDVRTVCWTVCPTCRPDAVAAGEADYTRTSKVRDDDLDDADYDRLADVATTAWAGQR